MKKSVKIHFSKAKTAFQILRTIHKVLDFQFAVIKEEMCKWEWFLRTIYFTKNTLKKE
jgi:hypothetical protein